MWGTVLLACNKIPTYTKALLPKATITIYFCFTVLCIWEELKLAGSGVGSPGKLQLRYWLGHSSYLKTGTGGPAS